MTIERFRQTEFWVITALAGLLLLVLVVSSYSHFMEVLYHIDALEEERIFFRYHWWQNGFWPLASIFLTTYACWYVLHRVVAPRFWSAPRWQIAAAWLLIGLVMLTGVVSYLYFWKDLNFRYSVPNHIIGAKVQSPFRLKNIAFLWTGLFFLMTLYTVLSQMYQWSLQQDDKEADTRRQVIQDGSGLALAGFAVTLLFEALTRGHFLSLLLIWVQSAFLHAYVFHHQLLRRPPQTERRDFFRQWQGVLLFSLIGAVGGVYLIFVLNSLYNYYDYFVRFHVGIDDILVFWVASLGFTIVTTLVRRVLIKPFEVNLSRNVAELSALRAQINPHFLFNAMNTLYATAIEEKAEKTSQGIQQLADMMRFMMHENNQERIDVQQEVTYLRNYIDLQRLRLTESDKLELKVDLDDSLCLRNIAPMLLVPFVENAFKHGISLRHPSWISIKLYCEQERLHFSVFNSLHPRNEDDPEKHSSGIGLVNVQKRLELLYPKSHQLQLHRTEKEFSAHLVLDFSERGRARRGQSKILPKQMSL